MDKPVIGVLPLWDDEKESIWMLPGYLQGIIDAGGIPVMLPMIRDKEMIACLADKFDGFLFTGGHDVNPSLYGEERTLKCGQICSVRDELEQVLFDTVINQDKPAFGICRGLQMFNVLLGGSLYQDLPSQYFAETKVNHRQQPPYDIPAHAVRVLDSPLSKLINAAEMEVNSYHHQSIKALSPQLSPLAIAPDGLVEAAYMPGKRFVWAVQWHPEFTLQGAVSKKLFRSFVKACLSD